MKRLFLGMRCPVRKLTVPALSLGFVIVFVITNHRKPCPTAAGDVAQEMRLKTEEMHENLLLEESLLFQRTLRAVNASKLLQRMTNPRQKFKFIMEPSKIFISQKGYEGVRWTSVVIVKSARRNSERRNAIRETWGSVKTFNKTRFITVFLLGRSAKISDEYVKTVSQEQSEFQDILLLDMPDTAENVPNKTLAGMQWVFDNLPSHWIYSSADDDISLHVPNFAKYIDQVITESQRKDVYHEATLQQLPIICIYSYQALDPPARNPKSKWHMPETVYPPKFWPPYCRGGWYSMPVQMAGNLYRISRWLTFLHLDDVWITGLMRVRHLAEKDCGDENFVIDGKLVAAPLANRTDAELFGNVNELVSTVIVSHAWGNINNRKTNVSETLREVWKTWLPSF